MTRMQAPLTSYAVGDYRDRDGGRHLVGVVSVGDSFLIREHNVEEGTWEDLLTLLSLPNALRAAKTYVAAMQRNLDAAHGAHKIHKDLNVPEPERRVDNARVRGRPSRVRGRPSGSKGTSALGTQPDGRSGDPYDFERGGHRSFPHADHEEKTETDIQSPSAQFGFWNVVGPSLVLIGCLASLFFVLYAIYLWMGGP